MKTYGDKSLCNLPRSNGKIELFSLGRSVTLQELQDEYDRRGLVPVHVDDLIAYVESHPDAPDRVGTQWKNEGWCYAACFRWGVDREVVVDRYDRGWGGAWWFAGLPQVASAIESSAQHSDTLPSTLIINGAEYRRV